MQPTGAMRLEISERQASVMELHHQGLTTRQISQQLKKERPKDKSWAVSHVTVAADIASVAAYYQQQAVDSYADWLARELARAVDALKEARQAFEYSKRKKVKGRKLVQQEVPDARFSREQREWQDRLLKLLNIVREISKPAPIPVPASTEEQPEVQLPVADPNADLAPYMGAAGAVEQFVRSMLQRPADVLPANQPRA